MTGTGTVRTEGATIAYDFAGDGPLLLTIAGGGGDAARYDRMAQLLADAYTVVNYDRRGNSRSTADAPTDLDMAQSARDAVAVIRALGAERAYVFGNSGGANIGLKLVEDTPEVVRGLVAHEPPIIAILPDAARWQAFDETVYETYRTQGLGPAMRLFFSELVGFDAPAPPSGIASGGPRNIGGGPNMEFFMAHEFVPLGLYAPDLDAIARNGVPIVAAAGRRSAEAYYARTARLLAERLGCRYAEFPGNHNAFMSDPEAFAASLREALRQLAP